MGDTLRISTIFSDSIEDLNTERTFKIEKFPFNPLSLLYRFHNNLDWEAGYRINELMIDRIYRPRYNRSSEYADHFRAYTVYENGQYKFELQLVLKEKGRYVLIMTDAYQSHAGGGNSELNAEADAITFEGKCAMFDYYICSVVEGEDHLELFEKELVHLDQTVYWDKLASIYDKNHRGVFGVGGLFLEWMGTFGFEVME